MQKTKHTHGDRVGACVGACVGERVGGEVGEGVGGNVSHAPPLQKSHHAQVPWSNDTFQGQTR